MSCWLWSLDSGHRGLSAVSISGIINQFIPFTKLKMKWPDRSRKPGSISPRPTRASVASAPARTDERGLARKLTLISAPAGFGKTTLLSEWGAGCKTPLEWSKAQIRAMWHDQSWAAKPPLSKISNTRNM